MYRYPVLLLAFALWFDYVKKGTTIDSFFGVRSVFDKQGEKHDPKPLLKAMCAVSPIVRMLYVHR
jgi:hypothetical protein